MNKIVIIGVYFGKFPEYMDLWLKSCEYNKEVDFRIFTDNIIESTIKNVKFVKFSLNEFSKLASEKLQLSIELKRPYKCCDFKSVYGVIFQDYIKGYAFWGHCDFDLIFGDIRKYITDDILNRYDKILPLGHLSLYRNTKNVNERYKCPGAIGKNYEQAFLTEESCAFDEYPGMYSIYKYNKFPFYDKRVFIDVSVRYSRFRLALKDKNYKNQIFYWEEGKVYRAYEYDEKMYKDEFAYIHFQKRKNMKVYIDKVEKCDSFFITNTGFYNKESKETTLEDINKYNKYKGLLYENKEYISYCIKEFFSKVKNKLKGVFKK